MTYPDNTFEAIVYRYLDAQQIRDRQGRWADIFTNALRQTVAVRDPLGRVTALTYCKCGHPSALIDPQGRTTSWNYDLAGRVTEKIYPDGTRTQYAIQPMSGRISSVTDAKGQVASFVYFLDDRLRSVTYSNALVATPGVSYTYDPIFPRLTSMTDGIGTTNYAYYPLTADPVANPLLGAGQLQSVDGPWDNDTVTYAYDQLGRAVTQSINGTVSSVVFDTLGRIAALTNALGSFDYQYVGSTGRLDRVIYPNAQKTIFSYLPLSQDFRVASIANQNPASANLSTFSYGYRPDGQITSWTRQNDAAAATTYAFGYDNADQLVSAVLKQGATVQSEHGFSYDPSGNRTGWRKDALTVGETVNALNQLTNVTAGGPIEVKGFLDEPGTVTVNGQPTQVNPDKSFRTEVPANPAGSTIITVAATDLKNNTTTKQWRFDGLAPTPRVITYDLNGNTVNDGIRAYTWNGKDQLVAIDWAPMVGTVRRTEITYNGLGQRVKMVEKTNGAVTNTITYLWVGGKLAEERNDTGGTVAKRYLAGGMTVGTTKYFFTADHLGSIREVTDSFGIAISRFDYDPYGNRAQVSGTFDPGMGFTGHFHHSSELALTWFRAYDPRTARWQSRDPIQEKSGANLYAYSRSDPVNRIDSTGLKWKIAIASDVDPEDAKVWIADIKAALEAIRNSKCNGQQTIAGSIIDSIDRSNLTVTIRVTTGFKAGDSGAGVKLDSESDARNRTGVGSGSTIFLGPLSVQPLKDGPTGSDLTSTELDDVLAHEAAHAFFGLHGWTSFVPSAEELAAALIENSYRQTQGHPTRGYYWFSNGDKSQIPQNGCDCLTPR